MPLVDEYGDNIIIDLPDGTQSFKYEDPDTIWYQSKDIVQYRIKEDWFLDKQRSVLDVRIIAVAPVRYKMEKMQMEIKQSEDFKRCSGCISHTVVSYSITTLFTTSTMMHNG